MSGFGMARAFIGYWVCLYTMLMLSGFVCFYLFLINFVCSSAHFCCLHNEGLSQFLITRLGRVGPSILLVLLQILGRLSDLRSVVTIMVSVQ